VCTNAVITEKIPPANETCQTVILIEEIAIVNAPFRCSIFLQKFNLYISKVRLSSIAIGNSV